MDGRGICDIRSLRPLMDSVEIRAPWLAAVAVRLAVRMPPSFRRRMLRDAFGRAERAFNRGDLAAVFALFAEDVEYIPPPPLHAGPPIVGRAAVEQFWQEVLARFQQSTITNLSIDELTHDRFVRTARLSHRGRDGSLEYRIRQTTELTGGRVRRQVNEGFDAGA